MKIYTRAGDAGQTGLGDGRRVNKDAAEMEFCGTLDELNSLLGMARAEPLPEAIDAVLRRVQSELFVLGAEVTGAASACRETSALTDQDVRQLEADIDHFDAGLPRLDTFVLPGGSSSGAVLHLARAVCRRAERRLVSLLRPDAKTAAPTALAYLNRLSDLLFVLARSANAASGVEEPTWPRRHPGS